MGSADQGPPAAALPDEGDATGDGSLWSAVQAGSETAFELLYRRHVRQVFRHCRRRLAGLVSRGDLERRCEEAVSETFLHAWRRRASIEVDTSVLPWLIGTASHVCDSTLRAERRRLRLRGRLTSEQMPARRGVTAADTDISDVDLLVSVHAVLARMRPQDAEVARMCLLDDVDTREAARRLNITESALRTRLHRVRTVLRLELDSYRQGAVGVVLVPTLLESARRLLDILP